MPVVKHGKDDTLPTETRALRVTREVVHREMEEMVEAQVHRLRAVLGSIRHSRFRQCRDLLQARVEIPLMSALLNLPKGGCILEMGCGPGNALPHVGRLCEPSHLQGIDLDAAVLAEAAAVAAEAGIEVVLRQGDVRALPLPDASLDMVIDFGTCYHITEPERAIREIARVLAPGGICVYELPLAQLLAHPWQFTPTGLPWHVAPQLVPLRQAGLWAIRRKTRGISVVRTRVT